ncbi:hypothetical protein CAEBREN_01318 [Caenorhabditis brenneri]|uniref:Serpentine receptor class r-10 n=1 Tax=Caenorhabditis brenneri TaxID=135651 RepID=G0MUH8_CAEBE|nr:hypothetical protein CAEBREN_01318 [Caenorhabditis brenneri]
MPMPTTLRYLQYTGFALTEIFSLCLFVLILTRASTKFGNYKYLMATFTIFSMAYGVVEVLTQPIIHIEGTALIIFVDSFLRHDKVIGFHMASLYCSSYGVCVVLLVTHFCYRYFAVCRPHLLQLFAGKRLSFMFLPSIAVGIVWFATVEICDHPNDFTSEYLRESLKLYYDEDSYAVGQLSFVYYYYDKSNHLIVHWIPCFSMLILFSIMGASITSIIVFALKTYKSVETHTKMSPMTRDLHRQLLHTLTLQSLVPFFFMFLPVGLLFIMPLFNVHLAYMANNPSAWIGFYPAIDAMIAMLMIKDFRNALLSLYCTGYGVCTALLSTNFFYRYLAVVRPYSLRHFTGCKLVFIFVPALVYGTIWFVTVEICNAPTNFSKEYMRLFSKCLKAFRESVKLLYNEDIYGIAQLSLAYCYYDKNHQLIIQWNQCFSIFVLFLLMGLAISTIIIFGFKTYKFVKNHSAMSNTTRDLHRQLFHTLILQSLVPFFILFLPVTVVFSLLFFDVPLGYLSNISNVGICFYPAVDTMIALFMIRDFRTAVFCRRRGATVRVKANFDSVTGYTLGGIVH